MEKLSHVLKSTATHPSSLRVLYDEKNIVYASNALKLALIKKEESKIINLSDLLSSEVLNTIQHVNSDQEIQQYQNNDENWYGKIFSVPINTERSLNLLVAV